MHAPRRALRLAPPSRPAGLGAHRGAFGAPSTGMARPALYAPIASISAARPRSADTPNGSAQTTRSTRRGSPTPLRAACTSRRSRWCGPIERGRGRGAGTAGRRRRAAPSSVELASPRSAPHAERRRCGGSPRRPGTPPRPRRTAPCRGARRDRWSRRGPPGPSRPLRAIWETAPELRFVRDFQASDLWGFCAGCYSASLCSGLGRAAAGAREPRGGGRVGGLNRLRARVEGRVESGERGRVFAAANVLCAALERRRSWSVHARSAGCTCAPRSAGMRCAVCR